MRRRVRAPKRSVFGSTATRPCSGRLGSSVRTPQYPPDMALQSLEECQDVPALQLTAQDHFADRIHDLAIVEINGIGSSSESSGPQTRPYPWHSRALGGAVQQHHFRTHASLRRRGRDASYPRAQGRLHCGSLKIIGLASQSRSRAG